MQNFVQMLKEKYKSFQSFMKVYSQQLKETPLSEISTAALNLHIQHPFCQSHYVKGPQSTHIPGSLLFSAGDWNELQQTLKLDSLISISSLGDSIMDTLTELWLLCVMYCCFYLLALCAVVCAQ